VVAALVVFVGLIVVAVVVVLAAFVVVAVVLFLYFSFIFGYEI